MKYLKTKLSLYISLILIFTVIALTAISSVLYYQSSMSQSEQNSAYLAGAYKQVIGSEMNAYRNMLKISASNKLLQDGQASLQERSLFLIEEAKNFGFNYMEIADSQGNTVKDGNVGEEDFFKGAKAGQTYFSSPELNSSNQLTIRIGTPIGSTESVLYAELPYKAIGDEMNKIKVGEGGYAFVINHDGYTVIHPNEDNVANPVNYFELAKKDTAYEPTAKIFGQMVDGKTGIGYSYYNGVRRLVGYTTLDGPEGWSVAVTTPVTQVVENLRNTLISCIGVGILLLLIAFFMNRFFAKKITEPIVKVTKRIELLAQGNLCEEVEQVMGKDESARLMLALQNTVQSLRSYILDISNVLNGIARKDLTVESAVEYRGDFIPVQTALDQIVKTLNVTLTEINQATFQVRSGSEQVALGGQNLAQNSAEQSATTERLTDSLELVSQHIQENAEHSLSMNHMTKSALIEIQQGDQEMQKMLQSMESIDSSAKQIQHIIRVIDDIAAQTNILALNAAIEATRAGEAGKGFSVVADEVRNLALKSAEAAKSTTDLIENTIQSVSEGMKNVVQTAEAFNKIVEQTQTIDTLVGKVTESLETQAKSVTDLNEGMKQISAVTQANSATAEESAATSEDLLSQIQTLEERVLEFKMN